MVYNIHLPWTGFSTEYLPKYNYRSRTVYFMYSIIECVFDFASKSSCFISLGWGHILWCAVKTDFSSRRRSSMGWSKWKVFIKNKIRPNMFLNGGEEASSNFSSLKIFFTVFLMNEHKHIYIAELKDQVGFLYSWWKLSISLVICLTCPFKIYIKCGSNHRFFPPI